jgi:hypothetical protein
MKNPRHLTIIATLIVCATAAIVCGQPRVLAPKTPEALIADLYQAHKNKRSPFFQRRSRALLDKYFAKSVADLIWKDAHGPKDDVGVIDGDPLYDAQDMEIKNFAVGKAEVEGAKAKVNVFFENFGQKKSLVFMLGKGTTGWRINDIDYGAEGTLRGWFKKGAK